MKSRALRPLDFTRVFLSPSSFLLEFHILSDISSNNQSGLLSGILCNWYVHVYLAKKKRTCFSPKFTGPRGCRFSNPPAAKGGLTMGCQAWNSHQWSRHVHRVLWQTCACYFLFELFKSTRSNIQRVAFGILLTIELQPAEIERFMNVAFPLLLLQHSLQPASMPVLVTTLAVDMAVSMLYHVDFGCGQTWRWWPLKWHRSWMVMSLCLQHISTLPHNEKQQQV